MPTSFHVIRCIKNLDIAFSDFFVCRNSQAFLLSVSNQSNGKRTDCKSIGGEESKLKLSGVRLRRKLFPLNLLPNHNIFITFAPDIVATPPHFMRLWRNWQTRQT